MFLNPQPSPEQLDVLYSLYYAASNEPVGVAGAAGVGGHRPKLRKLFHRFSGDVDPRDFVQMNKNTKALDYGCGKGTYLISFQREGFDVLGVEVSQDAVDQCRRLGCKVVHIDTTSALPFPKDTFDIVYLMQVLEHVKDPHALIEDFRRVLKPGGFIYVSIPNAESIWRKIFGKNWVSGWFTPFHLFHFSERSLQMLTEKHGFRVEWVRKSTPDSWFRLNLKAFLMADATKVEKRIILIDHLLARAFIMLCLRFCELWIKERDCLVLRAKKN